MNEQLYQDVKAFVRVKLWEPKGGLKPETRLYQDIRIAGLDGQDFMEAYAERFCVDMTDFDCQKYFGPEAGGCLPLAPVVWLYYRLIAPERNEDRTPAITLRDLTAWAEAGRWSPRRN